MAKSGIKGYNVLLTGDKKTPEDNTDGKIRRSFWIEVTKQDRLQWTDTHTRRHGMFSYLWRSEDKS